MASTIVFDCEGVACEMLRAVQGPLETALKTTMRYTFDVFRDTLQRCLFFLFRLCQVFLLL